MLVSDPVALKFLRGITDLWKWVFRSSWIQRPDIVPKALCRQALSHGGSSSLTTCPFCRGREPCAADSTTGEYGLTQS